MQHGQMLSQSPMVNSAEKSIQKRPCMHFAIKKQQGKSGGIEVSSQFIVSLY